jgi:hypothetical protein
MKTTIQLQALLLSAALVCGPALGWAQENSSGRADTSQDRSAKQDMKDAGHETKGAAKDAAQGTKKETGKAYRSTKNGSKKAWSKTKNTTKGAVEGGKEGAKQPPQ